MCRRDQGGFTLYEVLVAILLIGLVVGALTAGVLSALRASATANASARASVLLTSFEETLLQLTYRPCTEGDLVGLYQTDFENADDQLPAHRRIRTPGRDVQARIVSADSGCSGGGTADDGEQELEVELTYQGRTRNGNVVKRDPEPPDRLLTAKFDVTVVTGKMDVNDPDYDPLRSEGELVGIFRVDPSPSFSPAAIEEYRWNCNAANNPNGPTGEVVKTIADPTHECSYNAASGDETYNIVLTIRDSRGSVATSNAVTVTVGQASKPIAKPRAAIKAKCPATNCTSGTAPLKVDFEAVGTVPGGRTIVAWEWSFGDPSSGVANTSTAEKPSHTFSPPGSGTTNYAITLVVIDNNGNRSNVATHNIAVDVPGLPRPTASFTMVPGPYVLSPQTVFFDASASKDANGDPVSSYSWNFGDNTGGTGETANHEYSANGNQPVTRTVTLTVTASNGQQHSTTQTLTVGQFGLPIDFRKTHTTATYNEGHIYFSWTNPPGSAADRFEYDIEIVANNVPCTFFGTKTRTVRNSKPGTFQTYDFHVDAGYALGFIPLPAWVCPGLTYTYRLAEMRRIAPDGTEVNHLGPLPGVKGPL